MELTGVDCSINYYFLVLSKTGIIFCISFQRTSESGEKMSQVLSNPLSSDAPENNDPTKVETSKTYFPFCKKITDVIDILIINKCHTDPRFINNDYLTLLFITLKVQANVTFFQKVFLSHFLRLFLEVPM